MSTYLRILVAALAISSVPDALRAQTSRREPLSFSIEEATNQDTGEHQYELQFAATYREMTYGRPPSVDILALAPGQRVQFYLAEYRGSGVVWSYADKRRAVWENQGTQPESNTWARAFLVRTSKGADMEIHGTYGFGGAAYRTLRIKERSGDPPGSGSEEDWKAFVSDATGGYPEEEGAYRFSFTEAELRRWAQIKAEGRWVFEHDGQPIPGSIRLRLSAAGFPETGTSVALSGNCSALAVGQALNLTATAKPAGGSFRFWADPSDAVEVLPMGASATVTGVAPGKATLHVEYTASDGSKARASRPLSCVRLTSLNGNAPLQVGLYGADGKPLRAVRTVPIDAEPADASLNMTFRVANAALISVAPATKTLQVQGVKPGKTTVQAVTTCGQPTGSPLTVEVVPCDSEVMAQLRQQEKQLRGRLESNRRQQAEITGDDEFDRAAREGPKHIEDLAKKTAELIVKTAAHGGGAGTAPGAVEGAKLIDKIPDALTIAEMLDNSLNDQYDKTAAAAAEMAADKILDKASGDEWGLGKTAMEAAKAAEDVGRDLGTVVGAAERLEELEEQEQKTLAELEKLRKILYGLCRAGRPDPQQPDAKEAPKPDQKRTEPPPTKVTASGPQAPKSEGAAKAEEETKEESGEKTEPKEREEEKTGGEQVIADPPPPDAPKPERTGLLTDEEQRACTGWKPLGGEGGFAGLTGNLRALQTSVGRYRTETLEPLAEQVETTRQVLVDFVAAAKLPEPQQRIRFAELKERMAKNPPSRLARFGEQVEQQQRGLAACGQVLQNSFEVKIEELRTKY